MGLTVVLIGQGSAGLISYLRIREKRGHEKYCLPGGLIGCIGPPRCPGQRKQASSLADP